MGSDRENTKFTKIMTPLASKSFVLATPDNYEYFLSRYNMFSYIDAYNTTDDQYLDDDNVIYICKVVTETSVGSLAYAPPIHIYIHKTKHIVQLRLSTKSTLDFGDVGQYKVGGTDISY